jgi:hypothetical protein
LTYISKSTRRPFLLTRLKSHSYRKAIGPRNRVRTVAKIRIEADKNTCEAGDKNQIKNQFKFPYTFHQTLCVRVRAIKIKKLRLFDLIVQE